MKLKKTKNKISTGTLTYEDIKNKADYKAGGAGIKEALTVQTVSIAVCVLGSIFPEHEANKKIKTRQSRETNFINHLQQARSFFDTLEETF